MFLLLIRHGESNNNHAAAAGSRTRDPDATLTDLGRRQAQQLAAHLPYADCPRPEVLLASLMRRTIETAAPLAQTLDLPILAQTDTFEIGGPYQGDFAEESPFPGAPRSVLQGLSPRVVLPDSATEEGWHTTGFEPRGHWPTRAAALWQRLRAEYQGRTVALVSHGAFSSYLLRAALGGEAEYRLVNTGTAVVGAQGDRPHLVWFNRFDHLAAGDVTGLDLG